MHNCNPQPERERPADWQAELRGTYPIVLDATIDAVEDECLARWQKRNDPFLGHVVSVIRSLRREVAQQEHAWAMFNTVHAGRLIAELEAHKRAIAVLTGADEGKAAA